MPNFGNKLLYYEEYPYLAFERHLEHHLEHHLKLMYMADNIRN